MKKFKNNIFPFGKYKGSKVDYIASVDPCYIVWFNSLASVDSSFLADVIEGCEEEVREMKLKELAEPEAESRRD